MICSTCGRDNPADAAFCIYCAARLAPEAVRVQTIPTTGPTARLEMPTAPVYTVPSDMVSASASQTSPAPASLGRGFPKESLGAVWLIGLGVLFLTGHFFPGILLLVGITTYITASASGEADKALRNLFFFAGLAVLFWVDFIFPGILFLLGLMYFLSPRMRKHRA